MRRIFGVDIASGSAKSKQQPSYALFILEDENVTRHSMISRFKLIRLIKQMAPEIVAADNVHELASSRADLVNFMKQLPPGTKLVQATGGEKPEALIKVARRYGISFDRLNPMEEAEACARLAAKGVGHELLAFEDRTWIKVSRRRSPGRGGWSQKRYSRKIHGSVKSAAREVEQELRQTGHTFSTRSVEGFGGYIRCVFLVEAPRERVNVRPGYRGDAQIRVEGIERPRLKFQPLLKQRGYLIAGIDPGTTTGVAALDLEGNLVEVISARALSPSGVIEWLASIGKPLIVATDVFPPPGAVEKIKRSFNAVLYSPGEDIPAEEKIALAKGFGYKNDHERDALAAASSAYKKYRNKFQQVDKKCPPELDPDEVKALVVKGHSIDSAISKLMKSPAPKPVEEEPAEVVDADVLEIRRANQRLTEQVKTLKEYVDELKAELAGRDESLHRLERTIQRLKDKSYREAKRDHEIKIRDKEIARLRGLLRAERRRLRRLKKEIQRIKRAELLAEMEGGKRLKVVEAFSKEAVLAACERWGIGKGDVILLVDASGGGPNTADLLIEMGVDVVITESEMAPVALEYLSEMGIPVFSSSEVAVKKIDDTSFVDPEELEAAKARWAEEMKIRKARQKTEWLEHMVEEYRSERKKEARRPQRKH